MSTKMITPEVEQWIQLIAPRIAKHFPQGMSEESIRERLKNNPQIVEKAAAELDEFIWEMYLGTTERAKLARKALLENIHETINSE